MTTPSASVASPVATSERFASMDMTRGIAVLGILLMNIWSFAWPREAFDYPTMFADMPGAMMATWAVVHTLFEGTQRTLFSLLFGAGALMIMLRLKENPRGGRIYYRRIGLLILLGCMNAYVFLWPADILFAYGLCGLLLYPVRNLSSKALLSLALCVLALLTATRMATYQETSALKAQYNATIILEEAQQNKEVIAAWQEEVSDSRPQFDDPEFQEQVRILQQGSFWDVVTEQVTTSFFMQTFVTPIVFFPDSLAAMLIGMVLYRRGFLTLEASSLAIRRLLLFGYGIGLPVSIWESYALLAADFDPLAIATTQLTYDIGRLGMAFGHLGLVLTLCQSEALLWLQKRLQAVGQMALSNYLGQSILCGLIFYSFGLGLYGTLYGYEVYAVVFGVWVFQLVVSPIWLSLFRFGPFEWLWRSLTYGRKQPFLKRT